MLAMLRRCLCRDVYGSTMPFFAIGSSVLLGAAGLAVDLGRGELARADLQRAVDAAALATVASVVRSGDYLDDGSALDHGRPGRGRRRPRPGHGRVDRR